VAFGGNLLPGKQVRNSQFCHTQSGLVEDAVSGPGSKFVELDRLRPNLAGDRINGLPEADAGGAEE